MVYEIDDKNEEIIVVATGSHKIYGWVLSSQVFTPFFLAKSLSLIASIIFGFLNIPISSRSSSYSCLICII